MSTGRFVLRTSCYNSTDERPPRRFTPRYVPLPTFWRGHSRPEFCVAVQALLAFFFLPPFLEFPFLIIQPGDSIDLRLRIVLILNNVG